MTTDAVGGVFNYCLELARFLSGRNIRVTLVSMGPKPSAEQRTNARSIRHVELIETTYRLEWMSKAWPDVERAGDFLLDLERRIRPDVVHINGYAHASLPFRAPVFAVAHSCILSWFQAVQKKAAPSTYDRYSASVQKGLLSAQAVVTPSLAMLNSLREHYGPVPRARVIPNGVDGSVFKIRQKKPLVFSAGRVWDPAKNMGALMDVARDLPWPLFIAGETRSPDGVQSPTFKANVQTLGVLPPSELRIWLAHASVYALPALYEPFGLSALEGALSMCALVLGDIPSFREVWDDAALYVDPHNREALRDALLTLSRNRQLCELLGQRAYSRAQRFSLERMGRAYLGLYEQLESTRESQLMWDA